MTAKKCSCDLTYFDHSPNCEARTKNTGEVVAPEDGFANTGLNVHPEVAALASETQAYQWKDGRDMLLDEATDRLAAKDAEMAAFNLARNKVIARYADIKRLRQWIEANTKLKDITDEDAISAALNLLETARLMVAHLTPAVTQILKSGLSALQAAGVDVGQYTVPVPIEDASLGLATTEELLIELRARGDVDSLTLEDEEGKRRGVTMAGVAQNLLTTLPPEVLAYRTVDES